MMSLNADHSPKLKVIHVGDASTLTTGQPLVTIATFLSLTDKADKKRYAWISSKLSDPKANIRWVFKHRNTRGSGSSKTVALASIAAENQGKFWEYTRDVVAETNKIDDGRLFEFAQELDLDMKRFERDLADAVTKARFDADLGYALKLKLPRQGIVLINGRWVTEATEEALDSVLREEIVKSERLSDLGIPEAFISTLLTDLNMNDAQATKSPSRESKKKEISQGSFPVSYTNSHLALGVKESDALVTMVIFHDYQCSYSKKHAKTVDSLLKAFPKKLRVIYRHNALERHSHAREAAAAALAAVELGAGEQFHKKMMERPNELHRSGLMHLSAELGIDPELLEAGMDRHRQLVDMDKRDASNAEAKGTPHSFVNGRKIRGAVSRSVFLKTIQEEIRRAEKLQSASGMKGRVLYDALIGIPSGGGKPIP